ncbi:L,D-transpeptidase family protein [Streptomyces sp. NBC_00178]|uniref:L,D-transpeptidase family protein n=1 Tax=Streptomyces sp. NBC_00178 TaxID=2975672 RepID=UPI002E27C05D|nr:L,D-transpeptidase family protein [Streptomyces sp. NBC_00178]
MGRVRAGSRTGGVRAAAACAVVLAALTAGCTDTSAGPAGPATPPGTAASSPDDAKPSGGPATPSASATAPATPTARPSAPPRTLMSVGDRSERVRELQARLRQIGHFDRSPTGYYGTLTAAAVRSFQGKRDLPRTGGTDPVTWRRLLAMTRKPTARELDPPTDRPVARPDARCMTGRVLCISKNSRTLAWMIDGRVVSAMDVRFGSQYTPTREGAFSVYWKSRHHVSTLYDTPMPYAMFFSGGQAVHYSPDFAARGYGGASHGCVNVRDEGKIASLFAQVKNGDKVVVYR